MKKRISLYSIDDLENVDDYQEIVSISTNTYYKSKHFGTLIRQCINLEELYFLESYFKVTIPTAIFELPKLHTLVFKGVEFEPILPYLGKLKNLKVLGLQGHFISYFPRSFVELSHLEELDFSKTQFDKYFSGWELLSELSALKYLNLLQTKISDFPIELLQQKQLMALVLPKKHYNYLVKKHPDFCQNLPYLYGHSPLERKYFYNLLNICRKNNFDWSFRVVLLNLLAGNYQQLDRFATQSAILKTTDVKLLEVIRLKALDYYHQKWGKHLSLACQNNASIAVVGKLSINKRELQKKLKELGIKYSSKITEKTSHLLLGQLSHGAYLEALNKGIPILSEQYILDFINSHTEQYLVDEVEQQPEQTEHIRQLLLSHQEENILLALTFFKQGGFPIELLTELFIAYQQTDNNTIQREAQRLIRQYGSIGLIDALKKDEYLFHKYSSEVSIKRKLKRLERTTELDCLKIAWYGYQTHQKGISYLLTALPLETATNWLQERLVERKLSLIHMGLTSVPPAVFELKDLKTLDLSRNYQLQTISLRALRKLPQLEELILQDNYNLQQNEALLYKLAEQFPDLQVTF